MVKNNFFKLYMEMILSIIEDRPRYDIPLVIYKFTIFISFLQLAIHLFSDFQVMGQDDIKLYSIIEILNMVSIVDVLSEKGNDSLSLIIFALFYIILSFYFIYVAFLALSKLYFKEVFDSYKVQITSINEILNLFFSFYLNVFLSIQVELNYSIMLCGKKSLFASMRNSYLNSQSCSVPAWQTLVGLLGLVLTIITAFIACYFFRNYEFLEKNILKRKVNILFLSQLVIRVLIPLFEIDKEIAGAQDFKHLLNQAYGITAIVNFYISIPYKDQQISQFYLFILSIYESVVLCANLYFLFNMINGQELFYMSVLFSLIIVGFLQAIWLYQYEGIMQGSWELEKIVTNLDFYLEQICMLGQNSSYSEESKIQLIKHYKCHRSSCVIASCICHNYLSLNMKIDNNLMTTTSSEKEGQDKELLEDQTSDINMILLVKFIDGVFQWMLAQKCINDDTIEFEKLSLKYVSFMIQYQNNPVRAYHELKILLLKKDSFSIYFKMITSLMSKNIQSKIENTLDDSGNGGTNMNDRTRIQMSRMQRKGRQSRNLRSELSVQSIVEVEQLCLKFVPSFLQLIEKKQQLWTKLQSGYPGMEYFQIDAIKLMKQMQDVTSQFSAKYLKMLQDCPLIENSIQFQKLMLVYNLFIVNDAMKALQIEQKINDLKKMDTLADPHALKNENLIKGEICIVQISLSENLGKITSKKDDKTAQFFGFPGKQDFQKVTFINDLMPDYISRVHNQIVKSYLMGNSMRAKSGGNTIFSYMRQHDGYLFPIKIQFDFSFNSSMTDLRFNGILLKSSQEQDIIVFNRNGQVRGITKHLAQILFQEYLAKGDRDNAIQRLNILLLFPSILKRLINNKEFIITDLKKKQMQDQMSITEGLDIGVEAQKSSYTLTTLVEDVKGKEMILANPFRMQLKLLSYTQKKASIMRYDEIDILDQNSLNLLKSFFDYDINQSSNRSTNSDRQQQMASKGGILKKTLASNQTTLGKNSSQNMTKSGNILEKQLKFNYSIEYCLLESLKKDIKNGDIRQMSGFNDKKMLKQKKKKDDSLSEIYFTLRFENLTQRLHAVKDEKKDKKKKSSFLERIVVYLKSTTSLLLLNSAIEKLLEQQQLNKITSQLETQDDQQQGNLDFIPKISNLSQIDCLQPPIYLEVQADFINIPKKMLLLLQLSSQLSVDNDEESIKKQQGRSKYDDKTTQGTGKKVNLKNQIQIDQDKMTDVSQESDEDDEDDYEKIYSQIVNKLNSNQNQKEILETTNEQLENMMKSYGITKETLLKLDPNYAVKRLLQNRTQGSLFSKSFELSLSEAMIQYEIEQHKNKSDFNRSSLINQLDCPEIDRQQQCLTFRQPIEGDKVFKGEGGISLDIPQVLDTQLNSSRISDTHYKPNEIDFMDSKFNYMSANIHNEREDFALQTYGNKESAKTDYTIFQNNTAMPSQHDVSYNYLVSAHSTNQLKPKDVSMKEQQSPHPLQSYVQQQQKTDMNELSFQNLSQSLPQKEGFFYKSIFNDNKSQSVPTNLLQKQKADTQGANNTIDQHSFQNSTDKNNKKDNENANDLLNSQAIVKILNQKGIGGGSIQKDSIHSSSKTSNSYAGIFLKGKKLNKLTLSQIQFDTFIRKDKNHFIEE